MRKKKISYEMTARYRDGGSVDVRREVSYLVDGEWKRTESLVYFINAPRGSIQNIIGQQGGPVDKDLFDELSDWYKARHEGKYEVEMDAEGKLSE